MDQRGWHGGGQRTTATILKADLATSDAVSILLLREAEELLACVRLERTIGSGGQPACYIAMLAVRPGAQDRGVGRAMLQYVEAEGIRMGAQVARLTVVAIRDSLVA